MKNYFYFISNLKTRLIGDITKDNNKNTPLFGKIKSKKRECMNDYLIMLKSFVLGTELLFATILAYLGLGKEHYYIFGLLVTVDVITGILASYVLNKDITSKKMSVGIVAKMLILLVPLILATMGKAVSVDVSLPVDVFINMLIIGEGYSAIANIYTIIYKKELPEFEVLKLLLDKLKEFVEKMMV